MKRVVVTGMGIVSCLGNDAASVLNSLQKGDEVVTASGMLGKIVGIEDSVVQIEIADRVKVKLLKDRIAGRWADKADASS